MKKIEILNEPNITCDLIEKCLAKIQKKYPSIKIHKQSSSKIFYLESTEYGKKVGSLSKNKHGKIEFEIL